MIRLAAVSLLLGVPFLVGCSDIGEQVGRWAAGRGSDEAEAETAADDLQGEPGQPPVEDSAPGVPSFSDRPSSTDKFRGGRGVSPVGTARRGQSKKPVAMYINSAGEVVKVDSVDKVPEQYRGTMIVIGKALPDGGAGLSVVDDSAGRKAYADATERWQRVAQEHAATPRVRQRGGGGNGGVIVYQTSWCPACKAACEYLDKRRIPYTLRDVEKDAQARAEFSKYGGSSVPLVLVKGTPIRGFNPEAIEQALK